jgi:Protein of unknown function (DUF3500)
MRQFLDRASMSFAAGAFGALANSVAIWAAGAYHLTARLWLPVHAAFASLVAARDASASADQASTRSGQRSRNSRARCSPFVLSRFVLSRSIDRLRGRIWMFMGVAPLLAHEGEGVLDPVLLRERDLAIQIVRALEGEEREQAILADRSMGDILSGPGREESLRTPIGLPLRRLSDARRNAVVALVQEYLVRLRRELADVELARLREAGVENLHFAWAGALDPGQPHYYRIHGPTLLLEYDNTQENANHIHSVWHDPRLSFGGDALRDHYERSHERW